MPRDERWIGSNRAHVLTYEFFKQTYGDDPETILYEQGKLSSLKYWNAAAPVGSEDNSMRAFDAAAKMIRFTYIRNLKFEQGMNREKAFASFYGILQDGSKEVFDLALAVDEHYRFNNEVGFQ